MGVNNEQLRVKSEKLRVKSDGRWLRRARAVRVGGYVAGWEITGD